MKKLSFFFFLFLAAAVFAVWFLGRTAVFAQQAEGVPPGFPSPVGTPVFPQWQMNEQMRNFSQQRFNFENQLKQFRAEQQGFQEQMEGASPQGSIQGSQIQSSQTEERKVEFQKRMEEMRKLREEAQEMSRKEFEQRVREYREAQQAEMERRREEFFNKIEEIKDEHKKEIAKRLSEQINFINQKATDHFLAYLHHLELVLNKVEDRADKEELEGRDVSGARVAIAKARNDIEEARAAVAIQKAKVYVVEITSFETLGKDFRQVMAELRSDLRATADIVRVATKSVHDAFIALGRAIGKIPPADQSGEPSSTSSGEIQTGGQ